MRRKEEEEGVFYRKDARKLSRESGRDQLQKKKNKLSKN